ncbi:MAG TPA: BON domain-containing protein [Chloroflexia bacterium]|nr:BON domain-containing protein [Chloroflexia bacterium]
MDSMQGGRDQDSRDSRTGEGERADPRVQRDVMSEARSLAEGQDPVSAVNPRATPSDYTMEEIERGETPIDEEMESYIDPGVEQEQMSTNPDVLDLDESWRVEGEEPDFMDSPGTTDMIEAIEEGEPYFPPTDPPLRTDDSLEGVDVLGGFAATSLEEPVDVEDPPLRLQTNDEEIAERVRYALRADAYTTDLNIEVDAENGTVYLHGQVSSLNDIEQAEQIAGAVPGVEEVQEDLEIV